MDGLHMMSYRKGRSTTLVTFLLFVLVYFYKCFSMFCIDTELVIKGYLGFKEKYKKEAVELNGTK